MEVKNKTALVTGATSGIGKQIARSLGEHGYNVCVHYHSNKEMAEKVCEEIRKNGVKAECYYADIRKLHDIKEMFTEIYNDFKVIDILVNNAGSSDEVYFLDATEEMFDKIIETDFKSVYFCSQYASKIMIKNNTHGVIVNISSNQVEGCWPRATIYASTKAAVSKFTKNTAMELIPHNIRMVAVAPGYTNVGWAEDDHRMDAAKRLPMRRFASTKEIAEGVIYLISDNAGYITGTTLTIDGGATLPVTAANDFEV